MENQRMRQGQGNRENKTFIATSNVCSLFQPGASRSHKKILIDSAEDDLRKMGVKRWRIRPADRKEWRGTCEAAEVLQEL
jgi:hypothetical protein